MTKAPARSSGSLTIGFGMVNVPVKVYGGIEDSSVKRSRFTKDGHEVGMMNYDKETGDKVTEFVTKYKTADGTLVELTDEEIAAVVGEGSPVANIIAMVPWDEFSKYHAEGLLQVRPASDKKLKASPYDKAFWLFLSAMREEGVFALVEFTMRGKPRYGALTPDGYLRVLAYENEVREPLPINEVEVSDPEMVMARSLISTLKADGYVAVEDTASDKVREYAETKAAGNAVIAEAEEVVGSVDLMAALTASVEAAKQKVNA